MDGKMAWAKSLEKHGKGTAGTAGRYRTADSGQRTAGSKLHCPGLSSQAVSSLSSATGSPYQHSALNLIPAVPSLTKLQLRARFVLLACLEALQQIRYLASYCWRESGVVSLNDAVLGDSFMGSLKERNGNHGLGNLPSW